MDRVDIGVEPTSSSDSADPNETENTSENNVDTIKCIANTTEEFHDLFEKCPPVKPSKKVGVHESFGSGSSDNGSQKSENDYYDTETLSFQDINQIIMGGPRQMEENITSDDHGNIASACIIDKVEETSSASTDIVNVACSSVSNNSNSKIISGNLTTQSAGMPNSYIEPETEPRNVRQSIQIQSDSVVSVESSVDPPSKSDVDSLVNNIQFPSSTSNLHEHRYCITEDMSVIEGTPPNDVIDTTVQGNEFDGDPQKILHEHFPSEATTNVNINQLSMKILHEEPSLSTSSTECLAPGNGETNSIEQHKSLSLENINENIGKLKEVNIIRNTIHKSLSNAIETRNNLYNNDIGMPLFNDMVETEKSHVSKIQTQRVKTEKSVADTTELRVEPLKFNLTSLEACSMPPHITIKPVMKQEETLHHVSEINIKPVTAAASHESIPKLTLKKVNDSFKPIMKPALKVTEDTAELLIPKLTLKCIHKPLELITDMDQSTVSSSEQAIVSTVPKVTIKPIIKPVEGMENPELFVPKLTIKGIHSPREMVSVIEEKPDITSSDREHSTTRPKVVIKPISKQVEEGLGYEDTATKLIVPKLTLKGIHKPLEIVSVMDQPDISSSEDETVLTKPKVTIKPIVKPQDCLATTASRCTKKRMFNEADNSGLIKPIVCSTKRKITIKPIRKPEEVPKANKIHKVAGKHNDEQLVSTTVPILTIKPIVKLTEETIPKLTIKLPTESCIDSVPDTIPKLLIKLTDSSADSMRETIKIPSESCTDSDSSADFMPETVPKLTIKIQTDSSAEVTPETVPKLTIKIPSELCADSDSSADSIPRTVPKLTIKIPAETNTDSSTETVPKLTIKLPTKSSGNFMLETASKFTSNISTESTVVSIPDTAPRSTIEIPPETSAASTPETVPKLTIKLPTKSISDSKPETVSKLSINIPTESSSDSSAETVPKLTIKLPTKSSGNSMLETVSKLKCNIPTESSAVCISDILPRTTIEIPTESSDNSPPETVPKLTIKLPAKPSANSMLETASKFTINIPPETTSADSSLETVPKLTIKLPTKSASNSVLETVSKFMSNISNETGAVSMPDTILRSTIKTPIESSANSPPGTVPKLTIKLPAKSSVDSVKATVSKLTVNKPTESSADLIPETLSKLNIQTPTESKADPTPETAIQLCNKLPTVSSADSSPEIVSKLPIKLTSESCAESTLEPVSKVILKPKRPIAEDFVSISKVNFKPTLKPKENDIASNKHLDEMPTVPKRTIKTVGKSIEQFEIASYETVGTHSVPKVTTKPLVKSSDMIPNQMQSKPEITLTHIPKLTKKSLTKPVKVFNSECGSNEIVHVSKITIKPIVKPSDIIPNLIESNPEITLTHIPKVTIKPVVKPVDVSHSDIELEEKAHVHKVTSKQIPKPSDYEPLEINTAYKSLESGQGSPRIILKINKTNQGSTSEFLTDVYQKNDEIFIDQLEEENNAEKMKFKLTKQGSHGQAHLVSINTGVDISPSRLIVHEPSASTSSTMKRSAPVSDRLEVDVDSKRAKLEEPKCANSPEIITSNIDMTLFNNIRNSMVQKSAVQGKHKSAEKLRSESRLKEILSRLHKKSDVNVRKETIVPTILQKSNSIFIESDYNTNSASSNDFDSINIVELTDSQHENDSKSSNEVQARLILMNDTETSSSDCIILEEMGISKDPLDLEVSERVERRYDVTMSKVDVVNETIPINFDGLNKSLMPTKKRGRPRKNQLADVKEKLVHPAMVKPTDGVVNRSDDKGAKTRRSCRGRDRGTTRSPRGSRGRGRGAKRHVEALISSVTMPTSFDSTPVDNNVLPVLSEPSCSVEKDDKAMMQISLQMDTIAPFTPTLATTPRGSRRGRGSRGPRRGGRSKGSRGRGKTPSSKKNASPAVWYTPDGTKESPVQASEDDTRMSADMNLQTHTPVKQSFPPADGNNEESQSSVLSSTTTGSIRAKRGRMEVGEDDVSKVEFTVDQIAEYVWPPLTTGTVPPGTRNSETFMIQEQIALFLGAKSFKRKYPDMRRRPVEMEERDWITEKGLVTESLCDLGLTAVPSAEVLDIMCTDFSTKYEEYRKYQREKQAREFSSKQKALSLANSIADKSKQQSHKERAMESASSWNASFNKSRREVRRGCMDLQTYVINVPRRPVPPTRKLGHYPVAVVPGQYCDYYKEYTPTELRYFPLNTVLYGPLKPNEKIQQDSESEFSDSDSSSSDSDSDTSSDDTQGTEESVPTDCKICHKTRQQESLLLQCSSCRGKAHPRCLDMTPVMVAKVQAYPWQCTDCKTCCCCGDPCDDDKMLFCDFCDRGYHIYCVGLRKVPTGRWHCNNCAVCSSCKATNPDGLLAQNSTAVPSSPVNQWQHEPVRTGLITLCMPCAMLWRNKRFCTLCYRCHREADLLSPCKDCGQMLHSDCIRRRNPGIDFSIVSCIDCENKKCFVKVSKDMIDNELAKVKLVNIKQQEPHDKSEIRMAIEVNNYPNATKSVTDQFKPPDAAMVLPSTTKV